MPFVRLDADEMELILLHLPDDTVCHDLRLRLGTILPMVPHLPENFVVAGSDEHHVASSEGVPEEPKAEETCSPSTQARTEKPWPEGVVPFGTLPFGWRRHGERVVRAKEEQDIMKWILKGKKKGWTHAQIAADLNGRLLRTRRGSKWEGSGVGRLLKTSIEHEMNKHLKKRWG